MSGCRRSSPVGPPARSRSLRLTKSSFVAFSWTLEGEKICMRASTFRDGWKFQRELEMRERCLKSLKSKMVSGDIPTNEESWNGSGKVVRARQRRHFSVRDHIIMSYIRAFCGKREASRCLFLNQDVRRVYSFSLRFLQIQFKSQRSNSNTKKDCVLC